MLMSFWGYIKWRLGISPGKIMTWWEGLDFYVQYYDPITQETLLFYKCTCSLHESKHENTEPADEDEWDI